MLPDRPAPRPGQTVRGSTTGRPIMALFDLVGRRWALRIIWELHRSDTPPTFRELRRACGDMSSSVLTRRLAELSDARLVTHDGTGYTLSGSGDKLVISMGPLLDWSRAWAAELGDATPDGVAPTDPAAPSDPAARRTDRA